MRVSRESTLQAQPPETPVLNTRFQTQAAPLPWHSTTLNTAALTLEEIEALDYESMPSADLELLLSRVALLEQSASAEEDIIDEVESVPPSIEINADLSRSTSAPPPPLQKARDRPSLEHHEDDAQTITKTTKNSKPYSIQLPPVNLDLSQAGSEKSSSNLRASKSEAITKDQAQDSIKISADPGSLCNVVHLDSPPRQAQAQNPCFTFQLRQKTRMFVILKRMKALKKQLEALVQYRVRCRLAESESKPDDDSDSCLKQSSHVHFSSKAKSAPGSSFVSPCLPTSTISASSSAKGGTTTSTTAAGSGTISATVSNAPSSALNLSSSTAQSNFAPHGSNGCPSSTAGAAGSAASYSANDSSLANGNHSASENSASSLRSPGFGAGGIPHDFSSRAASTRSVTRSNNHPFHSGGIYGQNVYARSEEEVNRMIQVLSEETARSRYDDLTATIPPYDPPKRVPSRSRLIEDPLSYFTLRRQQHVWSAEEEARFVQLFVEHGKDFPIIAMAMQNRTCNQVVAYYYLNKHRLRLKRLLRRTRRRGNTSTGDPSVYLVPNAHHTSSANSKSSNALGPGDRGPELVFRKGGGGSSGPTWRPNQAAPTSIPKSSHASLHQSDSSPTAFSSNKNSNSSSNAQNHITNGICNNHSENGISHQSQYLYRRVPAYQQWTIAENLQMEKAVLELGTRDLESLAWRVRTRTVAECREWVLSNIVNENTCTESVETGEGMTIDVEGESATCDNIYY